MRTSPTNIGLWMLSALAARDFGYVTGDQIVETLSRTLETISRLERYEGHLLNWYDVQTLKPLEPRYVSTVDSGNLLGALWSLEHGLEELIQRPVLEGNLFEGLRDTGEVYKEALEQEGIPQKDARALEDLARRRRAMDRSLREIEALPDATAAGALAGNETGPDQQQA